MIIYSWILLFVFSVCLGRELTKNDGEPITFMLSVGLYMPLIGRILGWWLT